MAKRISTQSIPEVQEAVRHAQTVMVCGAQTKSALTDLNAGIASGGNKPDLANVTTIDVSKLSGILEYQPNEYTFTAKAGTPIAEVEKALAAEGQYLPFEPPLANAGATLGGTVAAGLSGAGRFRYGGVRDFLIGVHFVDGNGDLVMGGGKVVKNAAGFDLPKLMVGSLGRFGVIVDVSFKVFPAPNAYRTLQLDYPSLNEALAGLNKLSVAPMDIDAVELIPQADATVQMLIRIGGLESVLYARLGRLEDLLVDGTIIGLESEVSLWQGLRNFAWAPTNSTLVKIPISPTRIEALDAQICQQSTREIKRVYSVGGNLCWLAWPNSLDSLNRLLTEQALSGLVLQTGESSVQNTTSSVAAMPYLGVRKGISFGRRVQQGLDPAGKFLSF